MGSYYWPIGPAVTADCSDGIRRNAVLLRRENCLEVRYPEIESFLRYAGKEYGVYHLLKQSESEDYPGLTFELATQSNWPMICRLVAADYFLKENNGGYFIEGLAIHHF